MSAASKLRELFRFHGYPNRKPVVERWPKSVRLGYKEGGFLNIVGVGATLDDALRNANVHLTEEVLWEIRNGLRRKTA